MFNALPSMAGLPLWREPQHRASGDLGGHVVRGPWTAHLKRKPLPGLREPVVYWVEPGTTYLSSEDHSGSVSSDVVSKHQATNSRPLQKSSQTIILQKSGNIVPYISFRDSLLYHMLISREADCVTIDATCGSPYVPAPLSTLRAQRSDGSAPKSLEVLLDGVPIESGSTGERITCGSMITVGDYEFVFVDPSNIDEMVSFHRQCTKMERVKAAQDKGIQTVTKRVQHILTQAGLPIDELPSTPEKKGTYSGQTAVCQSPQGPSVFVWDQEAGGGAGSWEPTQDVFVAETAAMQAVDKRKAENEMGHRLASVVSGYVELRDLPNVNQMPAPSGQNGGPRLVRSPRAGMKVVEWCPHTVIWAS
eukprot:gene58196-biopygen33681